VAISLRLDDRLSRKLAAAARARGVSKSALVRACLHQYLAETAQQPTAWDLGKDLFGCYHSGRGDLSARAAELARKRAHDRRAQTNRRR
jgi:hypothetical protein